VVYEIHDTRVSTGKSVKAHIEAESPAAAIERAVRHGIRVRMDIAPVEITAKVSPVSLHSQHVPINCVSHFSPTVDDADSKPSKKWFCDALSMQSITYVGLAFGIISAIIIVLHFLFSSDINLVSEHHEISTIGSSFPTPSNNQPETVANLEMNARTAAPNVSDSKYKDTATNAQLSLSEPATETSAESLRSPGNLLTTDEYNFFACFGGEIEINGKSFVRPFRSNEIPALATSAPKPLGYQLERYSDELQKMVYTPAEATELNRRKTLFLEAYRKAYLWGTNSRETTNQIIEDTLKSGWSQMYHEILKRSIDAHNHADKYLKECFKISKCEIPLNYSQMRLP